MYITLNNEQHYVYTGGKAWVAGQPTVVMIHGVLNDHSVWILQSRYLAHHGYNVMAIDLPGHAKSQGTPPASVEAAAAHLIALLDAAGVERAALVGHSFGSLIALHTASIAPTRCTHLAMVGSAYPMVVSPALLDASANAPLKAIDMVNTFSHSTLSPPPSSLGPGTWLYGASRALMRRVLASNTAHNVFNIGFHACNNYTGGEAAMDAVQQAKIPTLFLLGEFDQMTSPKAIKTLSSRAPLATTVLVPGGHALMSEAPDHTLHALARFLKH
jgi:pimeloyl-ACP methyl ester carboxylesterase